jgi:5-methylcytosine-specific restriction protein A
MFDWNLLAETLSNRFGIDLSVSERTSKNGLLRVEGIDAPNGFGIEINIGWRSVEARFRPDTFASALIRTISMCSPQQRSEFSALAGSYLKFGMSIQLRIAGALTDVKLLPESSFEKFEIHCTNLSDRSNDQLTAMETASSCLALVLTLLPLESEFEVGAEEGGISRVEVNRYERSPSNRAAAIAFHGTKCQACGFDFSARYGPLGDGFVEIHHKTPVSLMGSSYIISPADDLIPLCSNCHRMVHRINPPMDIEDLVGIINSQDLL